jgi:hypothetical protein
MKLLTMRGPLCDLIRQIGLVIIIGMRYYPVYTVIEMPKANVLYYALCAVYMWIDLIFRVLEQSYCVNVGPLIRNWHRFQQFKNEMISKLSNHSLLTTTMAMSLGHDDGKSLGGWKGHLRRIQDRIPIKKFKHSTTTIIPSIQVNQ